MSFLQKYIFFLDAGLHTKFQFPVSSVTFLVSLMSATQELLFLEGAGSPNAEFIDSLSVRNIVESHPEDRLVSLANII